MAQTRRLSLLLVIAWLVFAGSAVTLLVLSPSIDLGLTANKLILVSG